MRWALEDLAHRRRSLRSLLGARVDGGLENGLEPPKLVVDLLVGSATCKLESSQTERRPPDVSHASAPSSEVLIYVDLGPPVARRRYQSGTADALERYRIEAAPSQTP